MTSAKSKILTAKRPLVIAHRGASGVAPENTMPAFEQAVRMGADAIELDLRLTLDLEAVARHDATIGSYLQGDHAGKISEMSYTYLRRFDAGYQFTTDGGHTFPYRDKGIHVPRLKKVLTQFPKTPLIIELKDKDPALVDITVELLQKFGRLNDGTIMLTSFHRSVLKYVARVAPDLPRGSAQIDNVYLTAACRLRAPWMIRRDITAYQLPVRKYKLPITTRRSIAYAHKLGKEVFTYTVNDQAEMVRMLDAGVDGIFTDYPHRLRQVVDSR